MSKTFSHRAALVLLMLLPIGCSEAPTAPTAPPRTPDPPPAAAPAGPADFPPVSKPARIYGTAAPLSYGLQHYTLGSRFVLYDDGTFALQYYGGTLEYRGTYAQVDGVIAFAWEGWSTAGPWGATGSLENKTLTVRFNLVMQMSDFEDAIYTLLEGSPQPSK